MMQEFVVFITNHWILSSLLAVALIAFLVNEWISHLGVSEVSPEQAVQLINHQEAIVLDIRTESLFSAGCILGAERITLSSLDNKMDALQKQIKKPIIVVSVAGHESSKIVEKLKGKGFLQVSVLKGGMQAWKTAGLPVMKA